MNKLGFVQSILTGKSVNYARGSKSAINKLVRNERQYVTTLGCEHDEQGDPKHHGGIEKALHIYPSEHYAQWQKEFSDKPIFQSIGAFGENLSSVGISEQTVCLGDILKVGSTLLQVSQGRLPCWKLNERFDLSDMSVKVQQTLRTGWYFRVLEEGDIGAGDEIYLLERPYPEWPISRIMSLVFQGSLDREELKEALKLPLVDSWAALIENRINNNSLENSKLRLFGSLEYH